MGGLFNKQLTTMVENYNDCHLHQLIKKFRKIYNLHKNLEQCICIYALN